MKTRADLIKSIKKTPVLIYEEHTSYKWALELSSLIQRPLRPMVVRYILLGVKPDGYLGSYIQAVIRNDLLDAVHTVDDPNLYHMPEHAAFFRKYAPPECSGNKEAFETWIERNGLLGLEE